MSSPDLTSIMQQLFTYADSMTAITDEINNKKDPQAVANDIQTLLNQMNSLESTMNAYQLNNPQSSTATQAFQCFEDSIDGLTSAAALLLKQGASATPTVLTDIANCATDNQRSFQQVFTTEVNYVQSAYQNFDANPTLANAQSLNTTLGSFNTYLSQLITSKGAQDVAGALSIFVSDLAKLGTYPAGGGAFPSTIAALTNTIIPNLQAGKDPYAGAPNLKANLEALWFNQATGVNSINWPTNFTPIVIPPPFGQ